MTRTFSGSGGLRSIVPPGTTDNSPRFQCAVNTEQDSRGRENPTRQLSFRRKQSGRVSLVTAAGEAPDVKGSCKRVSERTGPNMSEHRASLEKGNANADPVETWGRLPSRGKRAKQAPREFAGVLVRTCWRRRPAATREAPQDGRRNPPTSNPRGPGWVVKGDGEVRSSDEAG